MADAVSRFWDLIGWAFALSAAGLEDVATLPRGPWIAVVVALLAGLSRAIAQGIILFINQVRPVRFVLGLLINALLFAAGTFFLIVSTWLITLLPWTQDVPFRILATILGISYAPLIFSFLGALPYLGVPLLTLLSVWHLVAMVLGFGAITNLGFGSALSYLALGWTVLQILENTIGQPIANLGNRLINAVAGVNLITQRQDIIDALRGRISEMARGEGIQQQLEAIQNDGQTQSRTLKTVLGLMGMALLTVVVVVALRPLREWLLGWDDTLPALLDTVVDLTWMGVIGLVVAGLLAPLETLGWWAGWYEDEVDTTVNAGHLHVPDAVGPDAKIPPSSVSRYVVYLDGIGKSTFEYLPDIEAFLDALGRSLPRHMALIRGIIPYSVLNNPLDEDRPLAFLWKAADRARLCNPTALLGLLVNIRNILVVGVSADRRYGPLFNHGVAQVVFNGLVKNGYVVGSGTPITLIGYSGGGQISCACAPVLKRALSAPIDVISLGGVISGNCNILKLEQLYHLVGDKDRVEKIGPVMFPGRWRILPLSYWNRARRYGNISILSMGPVGHQVPGGILDAELMLPDGRTPLQQTVDSIMAILHGELLPSPDLSSIKPSNYERYRQASFNRPTTYPIRQPISDLYHPVAPWLGRLILPRRDRRRQAGVLLEVYHAPPDYGHLIGQTVVVTWSHYPRVRRQVRAVTKDVHFSADAEYSSIYGGLIHPDRLNHWQQVDPLESLAGSHPVDDVTVALSQVEEVKPLGDGANAASHSPGGPDDSGIFWEVFIAREPVQMTGRYYGLVQFVRPSGDDGYRVIHFNRDSRQFDGPEETVLMPKVIPDQNKCFPSSRQNIEKSPLNEAGWYIYGAADEAGRFVVQALAPRSLLTLRPDRVLFGRKAAYRYIRHETWDDIVAKKGKTASVLCTARDSGAPDAIQAAIDEWQEGDRALVLHVYGGIGGKKREPAAASPVFFGHFAYGVATVVRDPVADELRFDICYHQIYTHNTDGLISGVLHWCRYMGDRQFGWSGTRPVCDLLVKLGSVTGSYNVDGEERSPLSTMTTQLSAMAARYRIGDGTGGTYVGPANNCSQDSNQALFATLERMEDTIQAHTPWLQAWMIDHPAQAARLDRAIQLGAELKQVLQPFGSPRPDWEKNEYNLGSTLEDEPIRNLIMGLGSWRTLLPRKASDTVVKVFLDHGASVWVLRTNQIGGRDPDIEPIAPMTL